VFLANSNISNPYTNADLNFILSFSFLFSIIIICEFFSKTTFHNTFFGSLVFSSTKLLNLLVFSQIKVNVFESDKISAS